MENLHFKKYNTKEYLCLAKLSDNEWKCETFNDITLNRKRLTYKVK